MGYAKAEILAKCINIPIISNARHNTIIKKTVQSINIVYLNRQNNLLEEIANRNDTHDISVDNMFMNKNNNSDHVTTTIIDAETKKVCWIENQNIGTNHLPQNLDGPTMINGIINYFAALTKQSKTTLLEISQIFLPINSKDNEPVITSTTLKTMATNLNNTLSGKQITEFDNICQARKLSGKNKNQPCNKIKVTNTNYCKNHGDGKYKGIPVTIDERIERIDMFTMLDFNFEEVNQLQLKMSDEIKRNDEVCFRILEKLIPIKHIFTDGNAHELLKKVFKLHEATLTEKERKYLDKLQEYKPLFEHITFFKENWHQSKSLNNGYSMFIKKVTKVNKDIMEIRNKKMNLRKLLLELRPGITYHWIRVMNANCLSKYEALEKYKVYYYHKIGDHSRCFPSGIEEIAPCRNGNWNNNNEHKIIEDEQAKQILWSYFNSQEIDQAITDTWKGGSTSFNETFHSVRCHYAPKHKYFKVLFEPLVKLAVLDYNENVERKPIKEYKVKSRPNKSRHKHLVTKWLKEKKAYTFIDEIIAVFLNPNHQKIDDINEIEDIDMDSIEITLNEYELFDEETDEELDE